MDSDFRLQFSNFNFIKHILREIKGLGFDYFLYVQQNKTMAIILVISKKVRRQLTVLDNCPATIHAKLEDNCQITFCPKLGERLRNCSIAVEQLAYSVAHQSNGGSDFGAPLYQLSNLLPLIRIAIRKDNDNQCFYLIPFVMHLISDGPYPTIAVGCYSASSFIKIFFSFSYPKKKKKNDHDF